VEQHKVAIGIGLGVLSVLTGGAGLIVAGAFDAAAAGTALSAVGLASGFIATGLDARDCVASPGINGACTASFLGLVGSVMAVPELAVGTSVLEEPAGQQFLGLAVGGFFVSDAAALVDAGRALYDDIRYGSIG
jgi:hypothetical protein